MVPLRVELRSGLNVFSSGVPEVSATDLPSATAERHLPINQIKPQDAFKYTEKHLCPQLPAILKKKTSEDSRKGNR